MRRSDFDHSPLIVFYRGPAIPALRHRTAEAARTPAGQRQVALAWRQRLQGRCGICEYRQICGGSRARAYAITGDPYASEPDCDFTPPALREN